MVETDTGIKSVWSDNRLHKPKSAVEVIDPRGAASWDATVASFQTSTVFHTAEWTSVLAQTYGYEPAYIIKRDPLTMKGVMPLVSVHSPYTGRRGLSLPFTDFCQ